MSNRTDKLYDAKEQIDNAIDLIKEALADTDLAGGAKSYIIPSLTMCMSENHCYMGKQSYNLDALIRDIEDGDYDDIEDDEDIDDEE